MNDDIACVNRRFKYAGAGSFYRRRHVDRKNKRHQPKPRILCDCLPRMVAAHHRYFPKSRPSLRLNAALGGTVFLSQQRGHSTLLTISETDVPRLTANPNRDKAAAVLTAYRTECESRPPAAIYCAALK